MKWEVEFGRGKAKGKVLTRFFSFRAARKMPGNPGKKEELGGVSEGKRAKAHYGGWRQKVGERKGKRAKPCQNACRLLEGRGRGEGEALLQWGTLTLGG